MYISQESINLFHKLLFVPLQLSCMFYRVYKFLCRTMCLWFIIYSFLNIYFYLFIYVSVYVWVLTGTRRRHRLSWKQSYRWLWELPVVGTGICTPVPSQWFAIHIDIVFVSFLRLKGETEGRTDVFGSWFEMAQSTAVSSAEVVAHIVGCTVAHSCGSESVRLLACNSGNQKSERLGGKQDRAMTK